MQRLTFRHRARIYASSYLCFFYLNKVFFCRFTFRCVISTLTKNVKLLWKFLPRDAMHKRGICRHAVSVRLSRS